MKTNIAIVLLIALGFVFYRGLKATTQEEFDCEFRTLYAVCQPKTADAEMPEVLDIIKEGMRF